ncbi:MAG: hypothetical protein HDT14_13485 [Oscillibacter sp.]|nr:hypothetical protein [Oscillibacter sp.]
MSDCKEIQLLASLVVDGEASEAEQAELTAHLEACPACRAYFEDIRLIHESFIREEARLPEGFARHVMDRVRETAQDQPQEKKPVISFPHWRQWAALAACCAVVALGVWRFRPQEGYLEASQMARSAAMPAAVEGAAALPEAETEDAALTMEEAENAAPAVDLPTSGGTAGAEQKAADLEAAYTPGAAPPLEAAASVQPDSVLPEEQPSPGYVRASDADAPLGEGAGLLTAEEAQSMALAHAGLTGDEVTFTQWELEWEDGRQVYDMDFCAAGTEYDYEIDAVTGAVVKFDRDVESHAHITPVGPAGATLTQEQALEIALGEVPGAAADDVTKLELDRDDGIQIYEVKILYSGMKYELEISAADGTILEFECEEDSGRHGRH